MLFGTWLRSAKAGLGTSPAAHGRHTRPGRRPALSVERLEDRALPSVSPTSITIGHPSPVCLGGSESRPVQITLPPASVMDKVDVFLLFDDTGSFSDFVPQVSFIFSGLVTSLEAALPGVEFGFGVGRFEDYGGPGADFGEEVGQGRPFTLNQPIVTAATAGGAAARNALITAALQRAAPGFGGDNPEAALEGLFQVATGAGFDGNGNGSTLDSGVAGAAATQTAPGESGDVPAFSSNVAVTSGTLGGAGWRAGALHLVILATDVVAVAAHPAGRPIPVTIAGAAGAAEPSSAFAGSAAVGSERFGFVSDAKTVDGGTVAGAVAPAGAATVQGTVTALNALGIRVIGMGPGAAATADRGPSTDESVFLSALARLTGAVDGTGVPLVFSTSVPLQALSTAIVSAVTATATRPVDVGLTTTALPAGLSFAYTPSVVPGVRPGGTAAFTVTFTGSGGPVVGTFDIRFVDVASGAVLGSIPVTVDCSANHPPAVSADAPSVTAPEGTLAVNSGTYADPDAGQTVALTASVGTLTRTGTNRGTWSWSLGTDDGPAQGRTVTITASDGHGGVATAAFALTVVNVAPTATLSNSGPVDEGSAATVGFAGQSDPSAADRAAGFRYAYDFDNDGTFEVGNGTYAGGSASATATVPAGYLLGGPGSRTVRGRILDKDGGYTDYTTAIAVRAAAPVVVINGPFVIAEGGSVTLAGTITDPGTPNSHTVVISWGPGEGSTTLSLAAGVRTFAATHQYRDDNPSVTPSDVYPVGVTVTGAGGGVGTAGTTVRVNNVAPVITALTTSAADCCAAAAEDQAVSLTARFADVGTGDTHRARIDWGDGTVTDGVFGSQGSVSGSHPYAAGGIYTVTLTVTDDDAGAHTLTALAYVTGAGVRGGELQVVGTGRDDHVSVNRLGDGTVRVHADFFRRGNHRDFDGAVNRIVIVLCEGDDHASVAGEITVPALIDGGEDDDHLSAGGGPTVLLGGRGDDMLVGGSGRNILVGGAGADRIVGGSGDDVLIGGTTAFDADAAALFALLAEWDSGRDLRSRADNLSGTGAGPRLNGTHFLTAAGVGRTVFDDGAADRLTGSSGRDWFLAGADLDDLTDLRPDDLFTPLR